MPGVDASNAAGALLCGSMSMQTARISFTQEIVRVICYQEVDILHTCDRSMLQSCQWTSASLDSPARLSSGGTSAHLLPL